MAQMPRKGAPKPIVGPSPRLCSAQSPRFPPVSREPQISQNSSGIAQVSLAGRRACLSYLHQCTHAILSLSTLHLCVYKEYWASIIVAPPLASSFSCQKRPARIAWMKGFWRCFEAEVPESRGRPCLRTRGSSQDALLDRRRSA